MGSHLGALVAAAPVIALVLAGCQQEGGAITTQPTRVTSQRVQAVEYAPSLMLTGSVAARTETPLAFQATGQIVSLAGNIGDTVEAGDTLARISGEEQEADVTAAQATLAAAQTQLTQAQSNLDRQTALLSQGLVTRSSFERAQTAFETALSGSESAQAQLDAAEQSLSFTELKANAAGIITARNLQVGEVAQAGTPVFVLASNGARDAIFDVPESALIGRSRDTAIIVALLSDPDVKVEGSVREVLPVVDPQTGTVEIAVGFENPSAKFALGVAVSGVVTSAPVTRFVLPWSALWSENGSPAVWTIGSDGAVSIRPVSLAAFETDAIVIDGGLTSGDLVVVDGTKMLTPGQKVITQDTL